MWHLPHTSGWRAMALLKLWREWQAEQAPREPSRLPFFS